MDLKELIEEKSKLENIRKINDESIIGNNYINVNISDYNIEEIFNLLNIDIDGSSTYESIKKEINEKTTRNIEIFESMGNDELVNFFKSVKTSLLGEEIKDNITEAERLLLVFKDHLNVVSSKGDNKPNNVVQQNIHDNDSNVNVLNRKTVTKLLTVDSRFRSNTEELSTDFFIDLNYDINNVIEMKLSDLEFPTTYYPIDDDFENNYFWIRYTLEGSDFSYFFYVYIPEGNYYSENLINDINTIFSDKGVPLEVIFYLDYNNAGGVGNGNGKLTIGGATDNTTVTVSEIELNFSGKRIGTTEENFDYTQSQFIYDRNILDEYYYKENNIPYRQRFGWLLGFRYSNYSGQTLYQSEGVLDIIGPKYLYLVVDDHNKTNNVNFFTASPEGLLNDSILARISLKGFAFSIQSQNDFSVYSEPRYYYGPVNINKLNIKLLDEFGRTVNLNGNDMSFTLSFITVYSKTN